MTRSTPSSSASNRVISKLSPEFIWSPGGEEARARAFAAPPPVAAGGEDDGAEPDAAAADPAKTRAVAATETANKARVAAGRRKCTGILSRSSARRTSGRTGGSTGATVLDIQLVGASGAVCESESQEVVHATRSPAPPAALDGALWVRVATAAVAIAATTAQLIDFAVYDQRLQALDMMTHNSIFGVVSLTALGVAAAAALVSAFRHGQRRAELLCLAGLLGVLLALRIAQPAHVLLLALPASTAALVLLWRAAPAGVARTVVRDGCIVLVAAFVVHGIGAWIVAELGLGPMTWGYQLKAVVKHSGELAGWLLVASALTLLALERTPGRRASGAWEVA